MIVLLQCQRPNAALAVGLQGDEGQPLDHALPGGHEQILILMEFSCHHHSGDGFARIQGQHIDNGRASGSAACLGNLIALAQMDLAPVREEQDMVMGRGNVQTLHIVLFLQILSVHATAAPALGAVGIHGHPLDVAVIGKCKGAGLLVDQVLNVDLVLNVLDDGLPFIAELVPNLHQFLPQNGTQLAFVCQKFLIIGDLLLQLLVFGLQLFPVQTLQGNEPHIADGLGLDVIQIEPFHQVLLGVVIGGADNMDDLVNVVLGNEQALQQMCPLLGLAQIVLGSAGQDFLLILEVLVQNLPQGQNFRLLLVIHQGQHDNGEIGLQGGLLEEIIQHHLRIGVLFQLNDHAHTVPIRLVPEVGNAVNALVLHLVGNGFDQLTLVHLVGQLGNNDSRPVLAEFLELGLCPDDHLAAARGISCPNAAAAHDNAAGGEVRAGNVLHQIGQCAFRVIQHADAGIDDLFQVVGWDIGGHAHGDAGGAVHQQIGESAGENPGLLAAFVEVGVPVHGVLVNVPEHLVGDFGKSRLRVTVGGRGVAIHGAEVAVAVHQKVAHGEVLGKTHHSVVYGGISGRMVFTQNIAHAGGRLFERLVRGQAGFVHGVENAAMDRLQAVPHIRQGPANDDAHGVLDIGFLHFLHQVGFGDHLIRKSNILRFVASVMCHNTSPP